MAGLSTVAADEARRRRAALAKAMAQGRPKFPGMGRGYRRGGYVMGLPGYQEGGEVSDDTYHPDRSTPPPDVTAPVIEDDTTTTVDPATTTTAGPVTADRPGTVAAKPVTTTAVGAPGSVDSTAVTADQTGPPGTVDPIMFDAPQTGAPGTVAAKPVTGWMTGAPGRVGPQQIFAPTINYKPSARPGYDLAPGQVNPEALPTTESFGPMAQQLQDATYDLGYNLLSPHLTQAQDRLNVDLQNRGLPLTSGAQLTARDRLDRSQGEQLNNLALASVMAGRQEQDRLARLGIDIFRTRGDDLSRMFGERAQAFQIEDAASQWRDALGVDVQKANQAARMQARLANQQADLTAQIQNIDNQIRVANANNDRALAADLANQKAQLEAEKTNVDNQIRVAEANAQRAQQAAIANQRADLEAQTTNVGNQLQASQADADRNLQASLANQQADLTARIEDINNQIEVARANQDTETAIALANQRAELEAELANLQAETTMSVQELQANTQVNLANLNANTQTALANLASRTNVATAELAANVQIGIENARQEAAAQGRQFEMFKYLRELPFNEMAAYLALIRVAEDMGVPMNINPGGVPG